MLKNLRFPTHNPVVLSLFILIAWVSAALAVDMREGEWEHTSEMVMEGMPYTPPPTKIRRCITKEDLVPKGEKDSNCTYKDQKISGNTVRWQAVCKDKDGTTDMKGEITYSGNSYNGKMNMTMTHKGRAEQMSMKMAGKYLGPCKGAKDKKCKIGPEGVGRLTGEKSSKETREEKKAKMREKAKSSGKIDPSMMNEAGMQSMDAEEYRTKMKQKQEVDAAQNDPDYKAKQEKAEALVGISVPEADRSGCVYMKKGSASKGGDCDIKWGSKFRAGSYKVTREETTKDYVTGFVSPLKTSASENICVRTEKDFAQIISNNGMCGDVRKSGSGLAWDCPLPGNMGGTKGAVTVSDNGFDLVMITRSIIPERPDPFSGETLCEYETTGISKALYRRVGPIECGPCDDRDSKAKAAACGGREYTSKGRDYTSSKEQSETDKAKDTLDNPVKSIKKLFNW